MSQEERTSIESPDSALGTLIENTPDEEIQKHIESSNILLADNVVTVESDEDEKSENVISASMQFTLKKDLSNESLNENKKGINPTIIVNKETNSLIPDDNMDSDNGIESPVSSLSEENDTPDPSLTNGKIENNIVDENVELSNGIAVEKNNEAEEKVTDKSNSEEHISITINENNKSSTPDMSKASVQNLNSSANPKEVGKKEEDEMPDTVTKLYSSDRSVVYLVGTAHFSEESQEDVIKTIRLTKPDIIVLELCKARTAVLELDEETIFNESKSLNFAKVKTVIRQHGRVQGVLYLLFLSVSAHITKQLHMAPGGEFRVAINEAKQSCPNCVIQLGDRPIHITLGRALGSLSVWQKLKLMIYILFSKGPISKEEVEKCKQKDFIEAMLAEMTGQFPGISEVFVNERDLFLARSLQLAADPNCYRAPHAPRRSRTVVGVVGMGHISGIVKNWDKIKDANISEIMVIPPPRLSDKVAVFVVKASFYGLIGFGIYKCIPSSAKTYLHSTLSTTYSTTVEFAQTQLNALYPK